MLAVSIQLAPLAVGAQQAGKVTRIGLLVSASSIGAAPFADAFRLGLRELGYVEGKSMALEIRWGEGRRDLLHDRDGALADERDGHGMGAHAAARDAAGGVGRPQRTYINGFGMTSDYSAYSSSSGARAVACAASSLARPASSSSLVLG